MTALLVAGIGFGARELLAQSTKVAGIEQEQKGIHERFKSFETHVENRLDRFDAKLDRILFRLRRP